MPLTPGTTLGPYAVTAKIGESGMGEVCQPELRRGTVNWFEELKARVPVP